MSYDPVKYWDTNPTEENKFDNPEKVEQGTTFIEKNLWQKLEKVGSKIRFAKEIKALFRYLLDGNVQWYRKSIVIGALIYFISPIDAIPDIAPLVGYLDDLGVIMATVKFMGKELTPYYD